MKTKRITAALAAAALIVLGGAAGSGAFADAGYGMPTIDLTVTPTTLVGGNTFSGTATSNEDCQWSITYAGPSSTEQPITGSGTTLNFTFNSDPVEGRTTDAVKAVCTYTVPSTKAAARAADTATLRDSVDVTLTPNGVVSSPGNGGFGGLPNTGGPSAWLAVLGVLLTALGAGSVIVSRRSHA
ncbi:MAG TPA: LPXTG cell wall anchor domain-containing protein [Marmoricola sp.]|jgi:LPXTG-motif cell wall-anchored protein|nr:LPXTG cell wall anchor domain-containing protein [Marmoricola sp.]